MQELELPLGELYEAIFIVLGIALGSRGSRRSFGQLGCGSTGTQSKPIEQGKLRKGDEAATHHRRHLPHELHRTDSRPYC